MTVGRSLHPATPSRIKFLERFTGPYSTAGLSRWPRVQLEWIPVVAADALVRVILSVFLTTKGASLTEMGLIVGAYGFVWGGSQLVTGRLSDHVGRFWANVLGMWICGAGVALIVVGESTLWWSLAAGITGFGMALLYPNLGASVADITPSAWRGSAIGVYRFWRDLGYGIGALGLGLVAHLTGAVEATFWFVALSMFASGALLFVWGEESHPRLNPATKGEAR